ncbi:GroES-like protein [Conidiobolus coronatus NRRL 28638]|uniref:GroES-like protein n=1 Tax=Conidiobolus coronatus (strain ATCC 28846 / CBS 209.66 / NRRL 28638) TaxID=796925 RepID=A0A137NXP0_CONC2|nr:GroES-like protein [Conidiobolus coronatus NRRL 28638]|eukprot:KXN67389.1 GroES-like protein [Conidiobolus coronatus NRRL 28638]
MPLQVQFNKNDKFEDIKVVDVLKPTLNADDEVLVKITLSAINTTDIEIIHGAPGLELSSYPGTPGFEGVGIVEKVGKNVNRVKVGQRVAILPGIGDNYMSVVGTWSAYEVYKEFVLFPVPDSLSDEVAAQAISNPITAYGLLDKLNAPKGEYIVQSAAASSLGRVIIGFAKARGLKTINLVRHGADIAEEIKRITNGKGAYGALDPVGDDVAFKLSQAVRDDGTIILYSLLGGYQVNVSGADLLLRHVNYTGFMLAKYSGDIGRDTFYEVVSKVFDLFANEVKPLSTKIYPVEKVTDALHQKLSPTKGERVLLALA